ncbi:hypothetical protein HU200_042770 [Digitaria exilis]|uniref:Uncharacterized protein n=1 Tax=Digitaria exilis TaxID=1010633 RepID=A0A835BD43_9POAL|nr:hypothetical protein HU200_042770 [Digitaria exilis]
MQRRRRATLVPRNIWLWIRRAKLCRAAFGVTKGGNEQLNQKKGLICCFQLEKRNALGAVSPFFFPHEHKNFAKKKIEKISFLQVLMISYSREKVIIVS